MFNPDDDFDPELAELEDLSNNIVDLIHAGKLDEAERACFELRCRFPNEIDWMSHTAAIAAGKGQTARALEHYKRCLDFIDRDPDGWDEEARAAFRARIDELERGLRLG
jgi:hypothetical protein